MKAIVLVRAMTSVPYTPNSESFAPGSSGGMGKRQRVQPSKIMLSVAIVPVRRPRGMATASL
eukprot:CAMPEP_0115862202 /NCGR_PEP_ID=MMETSP0287-20121206/18054_1 /TAXON_ID=412157 /ORGANISM="Chrysochromulina rotalis, Strain UIO044" /LENGTH=61 /DNA_ID=CAMNT_0003316615 /DNA_START=461 /DNA_END=646 /DNA_ORIENTATION=+